MRLLFCVLTTLLLALGCSTQENTPISQRAYPLGEIDVHGGAIPRVRWVAPLHPEFQENSEALIWQDAFDDAAKDTAYLELEGARSSAVRIGAKGASLRMQYVAGEHGSGGRKLVFGDAPIGEPLRAGQRFDEIYWRFYLYYPDDWHGAGPDKLARLIGFAASDWRQFAILHLWDAAEGLTLDPVSAVLGREVQSRKYNDFAHFQWLGNAPASSFPLYTQERGRWVALEVQARLNTPGQSDGYAALWIDGRLAIERTALNFRQHYTEYGFNALFLEAYSNEGLSVSQSRYLDNFVVSTEPIGPLQTSANPRLSLHLRKQAPGQSSAVEIEIARDAHANTPSWRGLVENAEELEVSREFGRFSNPAQSCLAPGLYFIRLRERIASQAKSQWSPWHQPFIVASTEECDAS